MSKRSKGRSTTSNESEYSEYIGDEDESPPGSTPPDKRGPSSCGLISSFLSIPGFIMFVAFSSLAKAINPWGPGNKDTVDAITPLIYFAFCGIAILTGIATILLAIFGIVIGVTDALSSKKRAISPGSSAAILIGSIVILGSIVTVMAWKN